MPSHYVKAGVAGVILRGNQGDDAAEVQLFPLEEPPTDMAFEADRKIIERLKTTSL